MEALRGAPDYPSHRQVLCLVGITHPGMSPHKRQRIQRPEQITKFAFSTVTSIGHPIKCRHRRTSAERNFVLDHWNSVDARPETSSRPSSGSRTGLLREFLGCNPKNHEPRADQEHRIERPPCLANQGTDSSSCSKPTCT